MLNPEFKAASILDISSIGIMDMAMVWNPNGDINTPTKRASMDRRRDRHDSCIFTEPRKTGQFRSFLEVLRRIRET